MFWGPEWINYKFDGGTNTLRPEQGNQRARLYLGTKNTPPFLHMEGRKPRYIGKDGVVMLTEHGIPTRTTIAQNAFHSLKDPWLLGLTIALLISTTITFLILRQVRTKS